jgi:hypothetical protein
VKLHRRRIMFDIGIIFNSCLLKGDKQINLFFRNCISVKISDLQQAILMITLYAL